MKIRITDLLDDYMDRGVKLDPPEAIFGEGARAAEARETPERNWSRASMLVAAALLLVLTGAVGLLLGFQRSQTGGALAEGPSPAVETEEVWRIALALPIRVNGEEAGRLETFQIAPETGKIRWQFSCPDLAELLEEGGGDFDTVLRDGAFNDRHTEICNAIFLDYLSQTDLVYTGGARLRLGGGLTIGFENGLFWWDTDTAFVAREYGMDVAGLTPAYLEIAGVRYDFDGADPAQEETQEEIQEETQEIPWQAAETSFRLSGTRRGQSISFTLELPEVENEGDFTVRAVEYSDGGNPLEAPELENVTLQITPEAGNLVLAGTATAADGITFAAVLERETDRTAIICGPVALAGGAGFTAFDSRSLLGEAVEALRMTRLSVTETGMTIRFTVADPQPEDAENDLEAVSGGAAAIELMLAAEEFRLEDGSEAGLPMNFQPDQVTILGTEDGRIMAEFSFLWDQNAGALDPLAITGFSWAPASETPAADRQKGPVEAVDPDGDGVLTAVLGLPLGQEGCYLSRLTIDLATGDYRWQFEHPVLAEMLYARSPEGDLSEALEDEAFQDAWLEELNALETLYLQGARLRFTDGTEATLWSEKVGFSDGYFFTEDNLHWLLGEEDGKSPADLQMEDGTRFDFQ